MSLDKPLRLGVAGYGSRGRAMSSAMSRMPGVCLAAMCDNRPAITEQAAKEHPGVRVFADVNEMLDSGAIDALLIETAPDSHAVCAIGALERGIHVLSDVPAVHSLDEAPDLFAAAEASRAVYMFGENVCYWAYVDAALELKRRGKLGDPVYLEAEYVHDIDDLTRRTPWRRNYEPIRYCTHSLGPVLRWTGEELVSVSCLDTGSHVHADGQEHDAMVAIFRTASGVVVKVLCSFVNRHPQHFHRFVYYGTKGYFERSAPTGSGRQETLFHSSLDGAAKTLTALPVAEGRPEGARNDLHGGADWLMLEEFVRAVLAGGPSPIDVRDALRMTLPGLYALESARRGGERVEIRYPWTS